jgi:predicted nicotinamide N-methyase
MRGDINDAFWDAAFQTRGMGNAAELSDEENAGEEEIDDKLDVHVTIAHADTLRRFSIDDDIVSVYENNDNGCMSTIGTEVWDAAVLFCFHLQMQKSIAISGSVLELGSGVGLCGCYLKALFGDAVDVTMSDYSKDVMRLLNKSADRVGVRTKVLNWFDAGTWEEQQYDFVVGTALVYTPEHAAVADVIKTCLKATGVCLVIQLSTRPGMTTFLERCIEVGLVVKEEEVPDDVVESAKRCTGKRAVEGREDFRVYNITHM